MAKTEKITERTLRTFRFEGANPGAVDLRWDSSLPGFGVQIRASGRITFICYFRTADGRQRRMTLGTWGVNRTLDQARQEARKVLTAAKDGEDPMEARLAKRTGETVKDLVEEFLDKYVDARKRSTTAKEYRRQLETHVKGRWGTRLAKTIKRADVARLHAEVGERAPTQANRVIAAIGKMFSYARERGFVPEDFSNPCHGIERFEEHKRDRWVKPHELPLIAAAIDQEGDVYVRAFFWMLLFTGMRRTEARLLQWNDVNLEEREIRLEQTKAHRTHVIPLSEPARALLSALPKVAGNPYVFAGKKEGQPLGDVNHFWKRIRKAAGLPDVRVHDLRRSLGSWMASYQGASLPLIGAILNHSTPATTQVYARLAEDPRRQALEEHAQRIVEAAQGIRVVK